MAPGPYNCKCGPAYHAVPFSHGDGSIVSGVGFPTYEQRENIRNRAILVTTTAGNALDINILNLMKFICRRKSLATNIGPLEPIIVWENPLDCSTLERSKREN